MATKKEIHANVMGLCETHKAPKALVEALDGLLKPKTAGQHVDLATVTKTDPSGKVIEIMCQVSDKFLPATADFFYEDKSGKGIKGTDGKMLKRLSRQAESIRKEHTRVTKTSKDAIVADLLASKIDNNKAQSMIKALEAKTPDFSKISRELPKAEPKA